MKVDPTSILIPEDRQRKKLGDLSSLIESIKRYQLINPITCRKHPDGPGFILVAGERRLRSFMLARPGEPIEINLFEDLGKFDQMMLELEENIRRLDLTWQERLITVCKIHKFRTEQSDKWTHDSTAEVCGLSRRRVYEYLQVGGMMDDPSIAGLPTMESAFSLVERRLQHAIDREAALVTQVLSPTGSADEVNELLARLGVVQSMPATASDAELKEATKQIEIDLGVPGGSIADTARDLQNEIDPILVDLTPPPLIPHPAEPFTILNGDFKEWSSSYRGEPFTFLHLDFPYGIKYDKSDQAHAATGGESYEDSEKVFHELMACLGDTVNKIASSRSHMIFWFSTGKQYQVSQMLLSMGWKTLLVPLIWARSDNKGIAADTERRPRHTYETAFLCSRGDRKIFKVTGDWHPAPTARDRHPSHKPTSMLSHFFQMTIDEYTTVLDPTCGSGSALEAAINLGARYALGVEKDASYADIANASALRAYRLREANRTITAQDTLSGRSPGED